MRGASPLAQGGQEVGQGVDLLLAGRVMYPIDQGRPASLEGLGRADVRLDHHLFDQLVRWQDRSAADGSDPALGVHHDPALGALDGQGRAGPPGRQEPVVGGVEGLQDRLQQGPGHIVGAPLNGRLGLFVGQLGGGSHQSPHESVPGLPPRGVEDHPNGKAGPVLAGPKTAQSRRETLGQHGLDPVGEIDAVALFPRRAVQGRAGPDIGGDIGDRHPDDPSARVGRIRVRFRKDGVVVIPGVRGIDGDQR